MKISDLKNQTSEIINDQRLNNANRLLEDARLLRQHRRYPSAVALAILSLEEMGKFWKTSELNDRSPESIKPTKKLTHQQKQDAAARILLGTLHYGQLESLAEQFGYQFQVAPKGQRRGKTTWEFFDEVRESGGEIGKIQQKQHVNFIVRLLRGEFDQLKQSCIYADPTSNGWSEPVTLVDRKLADKCIKLAGQALYQIYTQHRRAMRVSQKSPRPIP
jgi:AbiV family abortive infection protein